MYLTFIYWLYVHVVRSSYILFILIGCFKESSQRIWDDTKRCCYSIPLHVNVRKMVCNEDEFIVEETTNAQLPWLS